MLRGKLRNETMKEFMDAVPHAWYVSVSDVGHVVAGDKNDIFSRVVIGFLADIKAQTSAA